MKREMRGFILVAVTLLGWSSAAAADEQPICADRPSKSTGVCTVPDGRTQIEIGLIDWTRDRSGGETSELTSFGSTQVKYGIGPNADIELGITPIEMLTIRDGGREHHSSFGDTILRVKYRLTREDAPVEVAVDPFVKLPTANHQLGNGKAEGGLLVPISAQIGKGPWTLSFDPELDLLADSDGHGRHLATQQVVNLGLQVNQQLSLSAEIWGMWDWDPAGTGRQRSGDVSAAYLVGKNVQLDAGANFGLNRQTPDVELYTGVSVRF